MKMQDLPKWAQDAVNFRKAGGPVNITILGDKLAIVDGKTIYNGEEVIETQEESFLTE